MAKPLILVTNDDGINAPGIRNLISVMKEIGDVIVVAPDSPQSGMGHAITINSTLHTSRITSITTESIPAISPLHLIRKRSQRFIPFLRKAT